jgi:asparagine synthase (glutamine-hydrolysing)
LGAADEAAWQQHVLEHLGILDRWERLEAPDVDLLGAEATGVLRRHGQLYPAPTYVLVPLMRAAAGGTLITGEGGDQLFASWRWADAAAAAARGRPRSRGELAGRVRAKLPGLVRGRLEARKLPAFEDWLTPAARRQVHKAAVAELSSEPTRWLGFIGWLQRSRADLMSAASAQLVAADHDVSLEQPFLSPPVMSALAAEGGQAGYGTRSEAMRHIFAGLLPQEVLVRQRARFELG